MKLLRPFFSVVLAAAVLVPAAAQAATPMQGVPTKIRRGFFTETDFGAFFTLGGKGKSPSDAQAYFHLGAGYDLYAQGDHFVAIAAGVGMGTSAGACFGDAFDGTSKGCIGNDIDDLTGQPVVLSSNWSATLLEGSALYGYQVIPRLMLTGRVLGGVSWVQPQAFSGLENPIPLVGVGVGAEWATQFDHFSLGLDIAGRMFLGTEAVGVSIAPRVKYTF
jgi:hypothetical protein